MDASQKDKQEVLKQIIRDLHAGVPAAELQKTFAGIVKNTSPEEIANMENALIREGFPPEEIQRLCDVHVQVFEKSLSKVGKPSKIPGHPVHTFLAENKETKKQLKGLSKRAGKLKKGKGSEKQISEFKSDWEKFKEIEKHYARKENQLFPALEAVHFTGPTQVMWGKHDEIREKLKETEKRFKEKKWPEFGKSFKSLESAIKKMIFLEEKILYPASARKLNEKSWAEIKLGESEIGYAWVEPSGMYDARIAKTMESGSGQNISGPKYEGGDMVSLSQGQLSPGQIDLLLKNLPFDVTFVDENDTVRYYSDTAHRIFPRSPGIIGRQVQNCHPPKSVHVVEDIIQSFRDKKKDVAEFWIQVNGQFVHIRYFPLYDEAGSYRGVIEVSQEISGIRKLEGERRILDW
ncbi:DUF438 domain-containing protein [bacterium]|nr:DUF438 domain-containing protein [bacterium]